MIVLERCDALLTKNEPVHARAAARRPATPPDHSLQAISSLRPGVGFQGSAGLYT